MVSVKFRSILLRQMQCFSFKVVAIVIGIEVLKRISTGYSGMVTPCQ